MRWEAANEAKANGSPSFGPYGELRGKDGAWDDVNEPSMWLYAGLYTVQLMHNSFSADTRFLIACDVMSSADSPGSAATLPCDSGSVAARCGASAVVFSKQAGPRATGSVTVPSGVTLIVLANLPPGEVRTLVAQGGLTIITPERRASAGNTSPGTANAYGRLVVGVNGAGTLTIS